ncbi:unnamed protein product [Linum trigynum]|uniref:Uncharacterized protein n=1 Tax=Linum trigynum TaxID=586398 RepID=A0AAV2DC00_9ROSI
MIRRGSGCSRRPAKGADDMTNVQVGESAWWISRQEKAIIKKTGDIAYTTRAGSLTRQEVSPLLREKLA